MVAFRREVLDAEVAPAWEEAQHPRPSGGEELAEGTYERAVATIERQYAALGHPIGWRFLNTPRSTLRPNVDTLLLSFHPGGTRAPTPPGLGSYERGSAYVHEAWEDFPAGEMPLQRKVQAMFRWLGRDPDTTLTAYFIPFRAQSFQSMEARHESFDFAVRLWRELLAEIRPRLLVCLGNDVEKGVRVVWGRPRRQRAYPVGWGDVTAVVAEYPDSVLLRLPHLSRFRIFDRPHGRGDLMRLRQALDAALAPTADR